MNFSLKKKSFTIRYIEQIGIEANVETCGSNEAGAAGLVQGLYKYSDTDNLFPNTLLWKVM